MRMGKNFLSLGFVCVRSVTGRAALLVVDVQDCFLEASTTSGDPGTLSVPASHIIPLINSLRSQKSCLFDEVIFSQDYHPTSHISFGSTHGLDAFSHLGGRGGLPLKCITPSSGNTADGACCPGYYIAPDAYDCSTQLCPPTDWYTQHPEIITDNPACSECATNPENCFDMEQAMWTDHCLQDGDTTFPPSLTKLPDDFVVQKGSNRNVDAYSAFMDNTQSLKTPLDAELQSRNIDTLFIVGIATDVCVHATVRDALGDNTGSYTVHVIHDATAAVLGDEANFNSSVAAMEGFGASLLTTAQVLDMSCPEADSTPADATLHSFSLKTSTHFTLWALPLMFVCMPL